MAQDLLLPGRQVLALAAAMTEATIDEAMALIGSHLVQLRSYSELNEGQLLRDVSRFCAYLEHVSITTLAAVTETTARDYIAMAVEQPSGRFAAPSVSTQHSRRSMIRTLFGAGRSLQLVTSDPARDIALTPRSDSATRPLTDDEELLCRIVAAHTLTEVRRPAAWALGQATATTTEQAQVRRRDIDLDKGRVWISGGRKRADRWGCLTEWGVRAIERALRILPDDPDAGVVYFAQRTAGSGAASVCTAVSNILKDAGFASEPDIQPMSLMAWAGVRVFLETNDIRAVARRLGCVSLDTAANVIGLDWHGE